MATITLEGMDFYSFHGHFAEEQKIGTRFRVDLSVEADTGVAEQSDRLHDTLDYQALYRLVKREMEQDSKLLEHVARRILDSVKRTFGQVTWCTVTVAKLNPPLGGKLDAVSVTLEE
ncbi:MAG TPA: dihydroneopterin aldolase [Bacteroidales bacterium]|nr:dihydroneopterin aldolase [Bacteroidales bacterium]HRZ48594.1 dihydroneopterin aldolase [Bacteroidales bacterium]